MIKITDESGTFLGQFYRLEESLSFIDDLLDGGVVSGVIISVNKRYRNVDFFEMFMNITGYDSIAEAREDIIDEFELDYYVNEDSLDMSYGTESSIPSIFDCFSIMEDILHYGIFDYIHLSKKGLIHGFYKEGIII